jgi:hypothetical protein
MQSVSKREQGNGRPRSKKEFVLWDGGVLYGGFMALVMGVVEFITHPERYYPLRPLTSIVALSWLWMLVGHPLLYFGAGCLYGLVLWMMSAERAGAKRGE